MKLNQLRDITAIAEHGSLRAAARHLGLAQPALTRSVHELEHELGAPLFERRARGMALTPAGEAFVRRARAILSDVRRAREEAEQLRGLAAGSVVAGLSVAAHMAMLPTALARFRGRYPDVRLHLIEGFFPTLEAGLRDGTVDFYIGPQPERGMPSDLVAELLFQNTRIVMARVGHPLAAATSLADLVGAEWVTTSITHRAAEELQVLFQERGLPPPRLATQTQSALSMILAIAYSDALGMLPVQFTDFALTTGTLCRIPVRETLPAPDIVMIRRAGFTLTPAAEWLAECCRRVVPAAAPADAAAARRRAAG
ncbi:LysR substrate-binding domain-containing protein [Azospirillum sp. ST 5-10]|uniref:LysR substrate-binding domain-containing protein n=1 Tax=unclassified Azospirillum TaxID=2630922 RepID=UPI003F4A7919